MQNYKKIPDNLITSKDLDYLKDMFGWNYINLKMINNCISKITNQEVLLFFKELNDFFDENLKNIIKLLEHGGDNNE